MTSTSTHTEHSIGGSTAAAISNHVVRTMSEYTGRGPTKARTYLDDDLVTVILQDTLTKGERSLVGDDLAELVWRCDAEPANGLASTPAAATRGSPAARAPQA